MQSSSMAKHIARLTGLMVLMKAMDYSHTFLHFFILSTFDTRYGLFSHMRLITLSL